MGNMDFCLQTERLCYSYSTGRPVLRDLSLNIERGGIFGFLGPNGAGKTTAIKLILGLIRRQYGEIFLFGKRLKDDRIGILRQAGSLVEGPSLYEHLTAMENLVILQRIYAMPDRNIQEVLKLTGLYEMRHERVGIFRLA